MLKSRVGCGSGVASMELLVVPVIVGGFFSILAAQYLVFSKIRQLFVDLDSQLAATIGKLLEGMPFEGIEQVNPIQQMIIQALAGQFQAPAVETIPPKDEKGRFR